MKTKWSLVYATLLIASGLCANAEEAKAPKTSAEFAKMKTLVGTWEGKTDMGQGPVDMTVQYRLLAGGSVLEERVFAGTPHEMVTMYYEKKGKLAMTHYCMFGNRPGMVLKSSDEKTLKFDFDELCGIDPAKESHMHALTIKFDSADSITTNCKAIVDGKELPDHANVLKRVKS